MAKPKKDKRVHRKVEPTLAKRPLIDLKKQIDWDKENPSWCFSFLDIAGPWSCNKASKQVLCEDIFPKLRDFESMTWAEIKGSRHKLVPVFSLSLEAKRRLLEIGQDDIDELFELSLGGRPRIWGILDEARLRILWWDPAHEVCPSKKKHT